MKYTVMTLGSMVVALIILGIPVLLMCSFVYEWLDFFKFVFIVATMLDFAGVASYIYMDDNN